MKQAIQEGFILDVLKNYTPVESYYRLAKTVEGDPEFDVKKARKKLRVYVESHSKAIRDKAEIMVDHFLEQVIGQNKIGGQARAMVVTGSIQRAIQYFFAFRDYLAELKSPYKAIVAFSGEPEFKGEKVSEAKLNGFPEQRHRRPIQEDPYRFLICADKFQTGYDEPLLHTMYVDKVAHRHQSRADALPPEPGAPEEARCLRARFPERHRDDREVVRRLLPHDDPQQGNRPEQAPHAQGRSWTGIKSIRRSRSTGWWSCIWAEPIATNSTPSSTPAWPSM